SLQELLALTAVGAGKFGIASPSITLAFASASRCASISLINSIERSICSSVIALTPPECSNFISRGTRSAQIFIARPPPPSAPPPGPPTPTLAAGAAATRPPWQPPSVDHDELPAAAPSTMQERCMSQTVGGAQARFIRMKSASKKRSPTIVNLTVKRRYLTER